MYGASTVPIRCQHDISTNRMAVEYVVRLPLIINSSWQLSSRGRARMGVRWAYEGRTRGFSANTLEGDGGTIWFTDHIKDAAAQLLLVVKQRILRGKHGSCAPSFQITS